MDCAGTLIRPLFKEDRNFRNTGTTDLETEKILTEEEEDIKTAVEKKISYRENDVVMWERPGQAGKVTVEEIFKTYEIREDEVATVIRMTSTKGKQMDKTEEKPSMWKYDPRSPPQEFAGLWP